MDAEDLLHDLCDRHGVEHSRGARLLPLVRWALRGPEDARERILAVVEKTLAASATRGAEPRELYAAADRAVLLAVARILHGWTPDDKILNLGLGQKPPGEEGRGSA